MTVLVLGRSVPQLSGMACATAMADILNKRGLEAKAVSREKPLPGALETFRRAGVPLPETERLFAGQRLALAGREKDFADIPDLEKATIVVSLDSDRIAALGKEQQGTVWDWPAGCSATLIKAMYDFYSMEIPRGIAGLLLAACLEETERLGSASEADHRTATALASLAGVSDPAAFGKG